MACPHAKRCTLHDQLGTRSALTVWQTLFCESGFDRCVRYRLTLAGAFVPLVAGIYWRRANAGGGKAIVFNTITVSDGISMGTEGMKYSLVSREVIADSIELTMRGHCYDALVGVAGCDKSLPGMMMAMLRLNVPSIFIYGGSILPGTFRGKQVTVRDLPQREHIDVPVRESLIVELYSK